jgi:hypothetical protein
MFTRAEKIFINLKQKPRWLLFFFILSVISISIEVLMQPYSISSVLSYLPTSVIEQDKLSVVQTLQRGLFTRLAFLPIRMLIGWGIFGYLLYYICTFLSPQKSFRFVHLFSLEVHAESALILAKAAMFLSLVTDSSNQISRLTIPFSCMDLALVDNYSIFTLLNSINIFTFVYIAFLALGVSTICGMSKVKAFLIVCVTWGIATLFNVGIITVLQDSFHFPVNY